MARPPANWITTKLDLSGADLATLRLKEFILAVREGRTPELDTMQWLADAFGEIIGEADPSLALHLKKKQGRKAEHFDVAVFIAERMPRDKKERPRGLRAKVMEEAANAFNVDVRKVEAHYTKHEEYAHRLVDALRNVEQRTKETEVRMAEDPIFRAETLSARARLAILFPYRPPYGIYTKKS